MLGPPVQRAGAVPTSIRVLIVDDDESLRVMLEAALSDEDDITVVGVTADAASALTRVANVTPDVVVLDNRMPGMSGIDVLSDLLAMGVRSVIVYTAHVSAADEETAERLGATVLAKGNVDDLVRAIRRAAS